MFELVFANVNPVFVTVVFMLTTGINLARVGTIPNTKYHGNLHVNEL